MKKIIFTIALAGIAFSAGAQNIYDAIAFSQNNYYGTARTMALGNAVAAIGGDLGTIGINPAGSAVAGYGQFTVTPGLTISSAKASYSPVGEKSPYAPVSTTDARMSLPNLGMSLNLETGNNRGVKNITFAFVHNLTNSYQMSYGTGGSNSHTSKFAEYAASATDLGLLSGILGDRGSYYDSGYSWDLITGYRANLFSNTNGIDEYVGNTEALSSGRTYSYVPGALDQRSDIRRIGYKSDIVFNFGMNISDRVFLGMNIGMPTMRYRYDELYSESAVRPEDFPIVFKNDLGGKENTTFFKSGTADYCYSNRMDGLYAKFGAIFLPTTGLRLGLAFQTPASYSINETWDYTASSKYLDFYYDESADSPVGEYSYRLRTPYVFDAGIAYTFGPFGFLSVDYELMDYSIMRFSDYDSRSYSEFSVLNEASSLFCGLSHNLRIGAELRVTPEFAIRAGYSVLTTPERYAIGSDGETVTASDYVNDYTWYKVGGRIGKFGYFNDRTRSASVGFGYSSGGSFFADFAARINMYPVSVFSPYYDYDNYDASGNQVNCDSPRITVNRDLIDLALTFGWRF